VLITVPVDTLNDVPNGGVQWLSRFSPTPIHGRSWAASQRIDAPWL
jgi:hypothetical protein